MAVNANSGPSIQFGITVSSTGAVQQYNEDRGPSLDDLGTGMLDPRPFYRYRPGQWSGGFTTSAAPGFSQSQTMGMYNAEPFVDFIPTALTTNAIVSNTQPAASGALTITATGVGMIATTIIAPENGQTVSVFAIDSTAAYVPFGQSGAICNWNPAFGTGRIISVTTSSSGDTGFASVAGRDMYGFKMTESVFFSTVANTLSASNSAGYTWLGKKAFKYISAVTFSSVQTSTGVIVGYTDTYGFPARLNYVGQNAAVSISSNPFTYNQTILLSSATVVLASTAATQTSTTPDVRGTYASTTATSASSTIRIQIFQFFEPAQLAAITPTDASAIFGAAQFSSV